MKKSPEIYDSIDTLPISKWNKVHETSDLSWLLINRKPVTKKLLAVLEKAWEVIYNEYLAEFGFSDSFVSIKKKEIEIAKLKLKLVLTGDRINETFIQIAEEELEDMQQTMGGKSNFMESKIAIESKFKFQINMMTTSVREFYSYLKHLK